MQVTLNYDKCIKKNGKLYCWNPELEQIEEIIKNPLDSDKCPDGVAFELLKLISKDNKKD